jgi:hypothetical protein
MVEIGDGDTLKLFDSKGSSVSLQFFEDLAKLESNSQKKRTTFIGPIYSSENWKLLQTHLAPLIKSRQESKSDVGQTPFPLGRAQRPVLGGEQQSASQGQSDF